MTYLLRFTLLAILFAAFCCSCQQHPTIPANNFEHTALLKWNLIGPYAYDSAAIESQNSFYQQDLLPFGINETSFNKSNLKKIPKQHLRTVEDKYGTIDFIPLAADTITTLGNVYLYTEFNNKKEQEVVFITDGSFAYKLWLNGEVVVEDYGKRDTNKLGDRLIPVTLPKGTSKIFVKISRGTNIYSWKFNLTITNPQKAKKVFFDNCLKDFLKNSNFSDTLFLYAGPVKDGFVQISDQSNKVVLERRFIDAFLNKQYLAIPNLKHLKDGYYNIKLSFDDITMSQIAYKGQLTQMVGRLKQYIDSSRCSPRHQHELSVSYDRLTYLMNKVPFPGSRYDIQYWQNNRVFYSYNLYKSLLHAKKTESLNGANGTLIKSYYSPTEKKNFHFLFQSIGTPEEIASKPVIIMVPYTLYTNNMITSWYYSSLDQIHIDAHLAAQNGFSIAWAFLRGSDYTIPAADEDIRGIMAVLKKDYNIDASSFYLDGDCVGGGRALTIASRNPQLFAGAAAHGPITQGKSANAPINLVKYLQDIPVCIVHTTDDEVVPINHTKHYIKEANKFGVHPILIENKNIGKHTISKAYHSDSFNQLRQFHKNKNINKRAQ